MPTKSELLRLAGLLKRAGLQGIRVEADHAFSFGRFLNDERGPSPPRYSFCMRHNHMDNEKLFRTLQMLVEGWCDQRRLRALRHTLRGYPLANQLTDGWAQLMAALQDTRAFAREEITAEELSVLDECVRTIEKRLQLR